MNEPNAEDAETRRSSRQTEAIDPKKLLSFGSKQIISLFIPVSICMIMVAVVAKTVNYYASTGTYLIYTPFHTKGADVATTIWQSLANSLILIGLVAVMSVFLVLLYKYKCYKVIHGYLIVSTVVILFALFTMFFMEAIIAMNIFMDYVTFALLIWNFGFVGFVMIHWKGPLVLQQSYLIVISAKLALMLLKFMPPWTTWVLLGVLAIWDLVAVLCPFGPLRILVEIAVERDEPIFPALIYSTTAATVMVKTGGAAEPASPVDEEAGQHQHSAGNAQGADHVTGDRDQLHLESMDSELPQELVARATRNHTTGKIHRGSADPLVVTGNRGRENGYPINCEQPPVVDIAHNGHCERSQRAKDRTRIRRNIEDINDDVMQRGDKGVKLGLGDFVFYSLLMGRATLDGDPNTILACYIAILVGMFLTILLLAMAGRALPALPISMACGILFYFLTSLIISPFTRALCLGRVFI